MTENKRFELIDDYIISYDGDYFDLHKLSDIRSFVTVVGYVIDENEQLKDENKELQERNERQAETIREIYNLIENKDWETLTVHMMELKKAEEQLQSEWQTYRG